MITEVFPRGEEIDAEIQKLDVLVLMRLIDLAMVIEAAVKGCILGVKAQQVRRKFNGKPVTITPESSSQVVHDLVHIADFQNLLSDLAGAPALASLFHFENGQILPLQQILARMIWLRGSIRKVINNRRFFQRDGSYRVE
ncbi:hypothetical protein HYW83_04820 [Candidatus Peregrinibacteria bacterium]|nr:hypothetical protein [Candidatus Peregrinibacteria bacterium]